MDVRLPKLADTLVEGTVTRWLKHAGEPVRQGEPLVEIETDKVTTELEAPAAGILAEVLAPDGTTVPVGEVIARIETEGAEPGPAATGGPDPAVAARAPTREERLAGHLRRAAARVPQGACVREIPAGASEALAAAAAAAAPPGLEIAVHPTSRSDLALPALRQGRRALLAAGAEREGRRLLTLCYDRRALDDWAADQLLKRIAEALGG